MTKRANLIRLSPKIFMFAAALDLLKQLLLLVPYWLHHHNQVLAASDYGFTDGQYTVGFFDTLFGVFLYPLGWVATAIIVSLLLELHDVREPRPIARAE